MTGKGKGRVMVGYLNMSESTDSGWLLRVGICRGLGGGLFAPWNADSEGAGRADGMR
jgi:hypothetical protein